jgi:hypothetical protein
LQSIAVNRIKNHSKEPSTEQIELKSKQLSESSFIKI